MTFPTVSCPNHLSQPSTVTYRQNVSLLDKKRVTQIHPKPTFGDGKKCTLYGRVGPVSPPQQDQGWVAPNGAISSDLEVFIIIGLYYI